jgi:anti-sigma B factor antagonist
VKPPVTLEIHPADDSRKYGLVKISGRLDAHSAEDYRPKLVELLGPGRTYLVGDLEQLQYISSAGLNLLIHICREARKNGGDFRLAGVQSYVREILDLTGYTKIFKLYDTVEQATASLG